MAKDLSLPLRQAAVTRLKASAGLLELVPDEQVYGMRQPAQTDWPFTRYGAPDAGPLGAGSLTDFTVHAFSKDAFEDECARICSAIVDELDGAVLALNGGFKAHVTWKRTQVIPDAAEANAWHGIVQLTARVDVCG